MRRLFLVTVICSLWPALAEASRERHIEGRVVDAESRWTADGRRIVTESVVRTPEGREVSVRQPGGSVDGVGMRVIPAPAILAPGDRVALRARAADDLRGRTTLLLREVVDIERHGQLPFVRTTNKTGAPLYWSSSCVFVTYDTDGTDDITGDQEFEVMDRVFASWRESIASCSYLTFEIEGRQSLEVGFDGVNLIKFRDERWGRPATDDEPAEDYADGAAGLTTLFFVDDADSDDNGQIFDADIELNGVNFSLSVDGETQGTAPCLADLANTLTHEVGHVVGLEHTCYNGTGERPADDEGEPVPNCFPEGQLSSEVRDATMYTFQDCGETKKATLEPDDIAGACAIYPASGSAPTCRRADMNGGCCSAAPARSGGAPPATLIVLTILVGGYLTAAARRRARRGARSSARR